MSTNTLTAKRNVLEWVAIGLAAFVVALLLRTFVLQTFYIPSQSMERTLLINDRVIVNKLSYKLGDIHRGDVVVFERTPSQSTDGVRDLIKRVIGLPGDVVEARNGEVYVNGSLLSEPYLQPGTRTDRLPPTRIEPNMVFVLGDNRSKSQDSRYIGQVNQNMILGKAEIRVWPLSRIGGL